MQSILSLDGNGVFDTPAGRHAGWYSGGQTNKAVFRGGFTLLQSCDTVLITGRGNTILGMAQFHFL